MTQQELAPEVVTTEPQIDALDTFDSLVESAWEINASYHDSLVVSELLGTYAHIECASDEEYEPMTAASYDSLMSEVSDLGIDPDKFDWMA